ncbi:hypothetical protein GGR26_002906 [Lewinella marina]|uniref:DUF2007 domain-containing protein n=1 Tax=Neolewinella marina TaxID=438751 RepID=A0A2G0CBJ4_9BACT|nr:hypothetical protein [Neolewinella marina]NJB87129.1 hypothetical protein [Neolewinella marina]PHK97344.1 hypothetical protein CGL56_16185 [Neolewinella marina]
MPYRRLAEVSNLQTLTLLKLSLNREEIDYRVHFEHSLYVGSYLLGQRGAVLEVASQDYPAAAAVLTELGIEARRAAPPSDFGRLQEWEAITESLPLIGHWTPTPRLLALALLLATLVAISIYYLTLYG